MHPALLQLAAMLAEKYGVLVIESSTAILATRVLSLATIPAVIVLPGRCVTFWSVLMSRAPQSVFGVFVLLLLSWVNPRAQSHAFAPASDLRHWTQVAVTGPIKPKLDFRTFGKVRIGNNASTLNEELLSAGLVYSPSRWISFGTGYFG
jgi:hypothetical protein